jgi:tetratricopeptide (TPR) repeat protein
MDQMKGLLAAAVVWSTLGLALPAQAGPGEQAAADVERSEQHFKKGTRAFESEKYSEAYASMRTAWDLAPTYRTAAGLGQVELHLGQFRDAAEHLSYCLRHYPVDGDPAVRAHVEQGLLQAREHVAALRVRVNVEGADVAVDGSAAGKSPLDGLLFVEPGSHTVTASRDGKLAKATVEGHVRATEEVELAVLLATEVPVAALTAPPPGEAPNDSGTASSTGLPPSSWALIVGGSLTAISLGTSVAFYVKGSNAGDEADALASLIPDCTNPSGRLAAACYAANEKYDERNDANRIGLISAIGAGVFAAATAVTFFVMRSSERSQAAAAAPLSFGFRAAPGGGILSVHGGF